MRRITIVLVLLWAAIAVAAVKQRPAVDSQRPAVGTQRPMASAGVALDPLSVGLEHYWTLDEATGDPKQDSVGTVHLDTPVGTDAALTAPIADVDSAGGGIAGNYIQATTSIPKKLLASFESMPIFNASRYSVAAWIYQGPVGATSQVWRTNVPGVGTEYSQGFMSVVSGPMRFTGMTDNTDNPSCSCAITYGSYAQGWYFVAYSIDTSTDTQTCWMRHASLGNLTNTAACTNRDLSLSSDSRFYIQGLPIGASPPTFQAYNGNSDETMIFSRVLTDEDIDLLWCGGVGKFYRAGAWECPS